MCQAAILLIFGAALSVAGVMAMGVDDFGVVVGLPLLLGGFLAGGAGAVLLIKG